MAANAHIARPYAGAVFALANEVESQFNFEIKYDASAKKPGGSLGDVVARGFEPWSRFLSRASAVVQDKRVAALLANPHADKTALADLIEDVVHGAPDDPTSPRDSTQIAHQHNFLRLLVANNRLAVIPAIAAHFEQLRAEAEGTVDVVITTAFALSDVQRNAIAESLSAKLSREVEAKVEVDPQLIGGAIVRAGDLVIDASVRGQLQQLAAALDA